MEKLKELLDLCMARKNFYNSCGLFDNFSMDEKYKILTQKINRLAKQLDVYSINAFTFDIHIGFESLSALKKVTGDEQLSTEERDSTNKTYYSASFFDGELTLYCYEDIEEEHKKAQAI